jgi:predicted ABC-type ATPase
MTRSPDGLDLPETLSAGPGLADRLRRLAHGHPSSPHAADGSARPPVTVPRGTDFPTGAGETGDPGRPEGNPRLADSRREAHRFTDAQWAGHVREVADRLEQARADGQSTDERYTVDQRRQIWAEDRESHHDALLDDLYKQAADVPSERRAIIAGGLPGAGKTTVLEEQVGIDRSQFLTVNPDDVKVELAKRDLIPHVPGLSPMEGSDLAHEESSQVAKRLARRAQTEGKNVIWDITMSSLETTQARIHDLRAHGYTRIEGVFVDLPPEVSAARADGRHRHAEEDYRAGIGLGGRFIPADVIADKHDQEWGSVNRRTFEAVKPLLDAWSIYDNSVDGRPAVLVDSWPPRERNP